MPSLFANPDVSTTAIAGIGNGLTVIIDDIDAVHPLELVTVTVYVPAVPVVMPVVVAPVLQA